MLPAQEKKPVVLVMGGHDPAGGAGVQADIETIASANCFAVTVITSLTAQNTREVSAVRPQTPAHFRKQIDTLLADIPINACKIGLAGNSALIRIMEKTLGGIGDIPVVLDPVLASGTGQALLDRKYRDDLYQRLVPHATVITPNLSEARELTGKSDPDAAGAELLKRGCKAVLITGSRDRAGRIVNILYRNGKKAGRCAWERLPGTYHGSGCTLSAAVAAHLALGKDIETAVAAAQEFTWYTLKYGFSLGSGHYHPNRFFRKQHA